MCLRPAEPLRLGSSRGCILLNLPMVMLVLTCTRPSGTLLTLVKDNTSFYASLHTNGIMTTARMGLNYSLFQGASFRINDIARENNHVSRIAAMPTVKQMWPLRNYSIPDIQRKNVMFNVNGTITSIEDVSNFGADDASRKDAYSPHVMTQVDRLRARGSTLMAPPNPHPPNFCVLLDMSGGGRIGSHSLVLLLINFEQSLVMVSASVLWIRASTICIQPWADALGNAALSRMAMTLLVSYGTALGRQRHHRTLTMTASAMAPMSVESLQLNPTR